MKSKVLLCLFGLLSSALALSAQVNTVSRSTAYEAGRVIKATPGVLVSLTGYNSKGSAQFIQLHDAAAIPSDVVSGVAEVSTVDTTGGTPAGLDGKYFTLSGAAADYYVWFDLDDGSTDPEVTARTGIEVDIATGDSEAQIATKLQTVLEAHAAFGATVDTNVVTITDAAAGARTDIGAGDSGLTVAVATPGVTAISATSPVLVITVPSASNFTITLPAEGVYFSTGIVVCNSSTGPTKTAGSADCYFTAVYR